MSQTRVPALRPMHRKRHPEERGIRPPLAPIHPPVSYVAPVREVSVVIGAWIGVRFMAERGGSLRIAASAFVAAGILLIALRG